MSQPLTLGTLINIVHRADAIVDTVDLSGSINNFTARLKQIADDPHLCRKLREDIDSLSAHIGVLRNSPIAAGGTL